MEENNLNIILIGMPGAGKTFIGGKLAKLLVHFSYIDTDEEIEKDAGLEIAEIFEKQGEKIFRELETAKIKAISENRNQIISIGGGAFENPENIQALNKNGLTFYLKAPVNEIFDRIKDQTHRPLLQEKDALQILKNLLKKREKNYLKAHFVIDTSKKQAYTILDDILKEYDNYVKCTNLR